MAVKDAATVVIPRLPRAADTSAGRYPQHSTVVSTPAPSAPLPARRSSPRALSSPPPARVARCNPLTALATPPKSKQKQKLKLKRTLTLTLTRTQKQKLKRRRVSVDLALCTALRHADSEEEDEEEGGREEDEDEDDESTVTTGPERVVLIHRGARQFVRDPIPVISTPTPTPTPTPSPSRRSTRISQNMLRTNNNARNVAPTQRVVRGNISGSGSGDVVKPTAFGTRKPMLTRTDRSGRGNGTVSTRQRKTSSLFTKDGDKTRGEDKENMENPVAVIRARNTTPPTKPAQDRSRVSKRAPLADASAPTAKRQRTTLKEKKPVINSKTPVSPAQVKKDVAVVRRSGRLREPMNRASTRENALNLCHNTSGELSGDASPTGIGREPHESVQVKKSITAKVVQEQSHHVTSVDQGTLWMDVNTRFVRPLLAFKTSSGCVFARWFFAIASDARSLPRNLDAVDKRHVETALQHLGSLCCTIARCEKLATDQRTAESSRSEPAKLREQVESAMTVIGSAPMKRLKQKSVCFQQFDLSTLNLNYVEEKTAMKLVDQLLGQYGEMLQHVQTLRTCQIQASGRQSSILAGLFPQWVALLRVGSFLGEVKDTTTTLLEQTMSVGELQACQKFYGCEFEKLVATSNQHEDASRFMETTFSSLASSLVRYRLRLLFLPYDPETLLARGQRERIATYGHLDFGAAVHRALLEIEQARHLVEPLLSIAQQTEYARMKALLTARIGNMEMAEQELVVQSVLATRYVRLSFRNYVLAELAVDEETRRLLTELEGMCLLLKSMGFEDESHLFPLATVTTLVKDFEERESMLAVLEQILGANTTIDKDVAAPCAKCRVNISRGPQDDAITCQSCNGRYHLVCLRLPASFAKLSTPYTCPSCFISRMR